MFVFDTSILTIHSILRSRPFHSAAILPVFHDRKGDHLECVSREISHCRKGIKSAISAAKGGACHVGAGVILYRTLLVIFWSHFSSMM